MEAIRSPQSKEPAPIASSSKSHQNSFNKDTAELFEVDCLEHDIIKEVTETNELQIDKNIYIPTWDNKPEDHKPVLLLGGSTLLTHKNVSMIVASPGIGKSSICEAVCASYLNPNVDNLGISIDKDCKGVIFVDNERTQSDVWNSFYRMCRRAGINNGDQISNVVIAGLRNIPRLKERQEAIENLLRDHPCSLLIMDGLGDLVTDSNDLLEAIECRIWLRELTVKYEISILLTIHPNPGSNKPRGHIGSEGLRESECVLLAKSASSDIRLLTTEFEYGKNRNGSPITTAFKWSDDQMMFIGADPDQIIMTPAKEGVKKNRAELLALKILPPPKSMRHTELVTAIREYEECDESTAKRRIKEMKGYEFIIKHEDGLYRTKSNP